MQESELLLWCVLEWSEWASFYSLQRSVPGRYFPPTQAAPPLRVNVDRTRGSTAQMAPPPGRQTWRVGRPRSGPSWVVLSLGGCTVGPDVGSA